MRYLHTCTTSEITDEHIDQINELLRFFDTCVEKLESHLYLLNELDWDFLLLKEFIYFLELIHCYIEGIHIL